MKKLFVLLIIFLFAANCFALEFVRQKNVATVIVFPLISSADTTVLLSSATSPDSEFEEWTDGVAPAGGFTDCTNEISEIGTTGIYSLSLANTEVDSDYTVIQIKSSDGLTQILLIRTTVGDPLNLATTDDGSTINVASGVVEADAVKFSGSSTAADNAEVIFDTDWGTVYDTGNNYWHTNVQLVDDIAPIVIADVGDVVWDEDIVAAHNTVDTAGELHERTISTTAAGNLEDTYDGTGYADDNAPATQLQLTTISGGVSVAVTASGSVVTEGEETLTYAATATDDGIYYEVASDAINDDIDFYLVFNTGDGMNLPVSFHLHGRYEDNNPPSNSTLLIQSFNFNISDWDTIDTLSDSGTDLELILPLHIHDVDPDGGGEGDVRIRFKLSTTEVSQNMLIDHAVVGYVSGGLTAAGVVDEWKTQSQADPTDFHINMLEVEGTDATTYIEGRTLATAAYFIFSTDPVELLDSGGSAGTSAAELVDDNWDEARAGHTGDGTFGGDALDADTWTDARAGYLDELSSGNTIYDNIVAIKAFWDSLTITSGLLETDMKKLDGTAVKSTSGNIHALPGNI